MWFNNQHLLKYDALFKSNLNNPSHLCRQSVLKYFILMKIKSFCLLISIRKKRMSWNDVHDKTMHLIQRASFKSLEKQYYCKFITECFELHQDILYNEIEKFLTQRHYLIVWVVGFCFQVELCALNISRELTAQDTEEAISGEQELWPCVKKMNVKGHFNIIN